jgi:arylsulfatase A-like enzyme
MINQQSMNPTTEGVAMTETKQEIEPKLSTRFRKIVAGGSHKTLLGALLWLTGIALGAAEKPNILIILSDDYGYGSAGCYGAASNLVRTPNLDRLAKEGRRFTDASTTSSVCSPTRYSLVTGRYCWRTSLKSGVLATTAPLHIETDRPTLASLLKQQGYQTAAIGKWHLGYGSAARVDFTQELKPGPQEIGFDYHFAVPQNHGDASGVFVENHRVVGLRSNRIIPQPTNTYYGGPFLGLDAPQRDDPEVMETLTEKCVSWIQKRDKNNPFFLYFTPVAIHEPVTPSKRTAGSSAAGPYGDWIHELDRSVGRLLDCLDQERVASNTLVLFTSDNGGVIRADPASKKLPGLVHQAQTAGLKICGDLRGGKHDHWEGGFRVPYLVRWPGKVPAGSVCTEMISVVDTFATLAALTGAPLPATGKGPEDSVNVLPAWLGTPHPPVRQNLITHSAPGVFSLREGPWKYIEGKPAAGPAGKGKKKAGPAEPAPQLYNLAEDPAETKDLAALQPEVLKRLAQQLETLRSRPQP